MMALRSSIGQERESILIGRSAIGLLVPIACIFIAGLWRQVVCVFGGGRQ